MVAFSPKLDQTLRRAIAIAEERRHEQAMLDHLLLALTDDEDAAAVMRGCNVDVDKLRGRLDQSLAELKAAACAERRGGCDRPVPGTAAQRRLHAHGVRGACSGAV